MVDQKTGFWEIFPKYSWMDNIDGGKPVIRTDNENVARNKA